jgi:3',5'-cyclic AMP phosphodiesterase CpdA
MSSTLGVTNAGGDYWWSYEGVLFMALNSNDMSTAEHRTFMEDAIAAYKAGSGGKDPLWKIVTFHHSVYSTASHTTDGDIIQRRNELPVVFEDLGIDAVLSGHDHVYTRSRMMDGTTPVTTGYTADGANTYARYLDDPERNETVYLTANSASGSKYYAIQNLDFPFKAVDNQESTPNISKVDVATDSLTFTTYRTGAGNGIGDVVDTFTLEREPEPAEVEIQDLTIGVGADESERLSPGTATRASRASCSLPSRPPRRARSSRRRTRASPPSRLPRPTSASAATRPR